MGHECPPPLPLANVRQKAWDIPRVKECYLDAATDVRAQARLLAAVFKEAGAWQNTPPISSLGLWMEHQSCHWSKPWSFSLSAY